jgi:hypothetical protein
MTRPARETTTTRTDVLDEELSRAFLERYAQALSAGDARAIASCWELPALVLSDEGATAVSSAAEVEKFFAQAIDWYRSRGLVETRPELERIELLSGRLAAVDVRWPAFDGAGVERLSERTQYILHADKDGLPRIRVALARTA